MKGVENIIKALVNPRSYLNLIVIALIFVSLFGVGIATFVVAVVSITIPIAFIITPFIYQLNPMQIGPIVIDTMGKAILTSLIGIVLLALLLYLANIITNLFRRYVFVRIGRFSIGAKKK